MPDFTLHAFESGAMNVTLADLKGKATIIKRRAVTRHACRRRKPRSSTSSSWYTATGSVP